MRRRGRVEKRVGREGEIGVETDGPRFVDEERRAFEATSGGEVDERRGRRRVPFGRIGEKNARRDEFAGDPTDLMKRGKSGGELREKGGERRRRECFAGGEAGFERSTGENGGDDAAASRLRRGDEARTNDVDRRKEARRRKGTEETVALHRGGADEGTARSGGRRFEEEVGGEVGTARSGEVNVVFGLGAKTARRFPTRKTEIDVAGDGEGARKSRDIVLSGHGLVKMKRGGGKDGTRSFLMKLSDVKR